LILYYSASRSIFFFFFFVYTINPPSSSLRTILCVRTSARAEPTAVVSVRVLISFAGELAIDDAITVGYDNDNDSARSTWAAIRDAGQKEKEKKRKAEGPHISRSIHLWLLLLPVRPSQKA
jgi:hypothetical protein